MEKYSPGSYRRIHGQKGPACKPGRMPRGRERPYPGWPLGSLGWKCHDCPQNSPEILFYYKATGRKRLDFTVLFISETHINSSHWQNLLFTKSVVFFYHFSSGNFSALLTNLSVNIIHPKVVSFAVPGKKRRMIKGPSYAIEADLNLNPGSLTTVAQGHAAAGLDRFSGKIGAKGFRPYRTLRRTKQFIMHMKHLVQWLFRYYSSYFPYDV